MARHGFGRDEYKLFTIRCCESLPNFAPSCTRVLRLLPIDGTAHWKSIFSIPRAIPSSLNVAIRVDKPSPLRSCCNMQRATTTVCIRIYTASTFFRLRWPYFYPSQERISSAASSC